jgi:hypothetical protein
MRFLSLASLLLAIFGIPTMALASQPVGAAVSIDAAAPSGGFALNQDFVAPKVSHTNGVRLPISVVLDQIPADRREVVLEMNVDKKGFPQGIRLISSRSAFLDLPVFLAANQFRFNPARFHNQPVPADIRLTVQVID